jgi:hypothetical protein
MSSKNSITYNKSLSESLDYYYLRKAGIQYVQELSGDIWTDYNDHDPGVTILEQLCYALTDVGYRSQVDIEKLLFASGNFKEVAAANGLYFPEEILPTHPTTFQDFRAVFLYAFRDEIANIRFEKASDTNAGLMNVYIQTEHKEPDSSKQSLLHRIHKFFSAHRNLSEDINEIVLLKPQSLDLSARIDIGEKEIPEEVIAELYFQLEEYFNPKVKWNSLESLQKKGYDNTAVFDTASWKCGFLETGLSSGESQCFTLPNIQRCMLSVPGIRHVRDLKIFKNGILVSQDLVTIDKGHYVKFSDALNNKDLHVYKNQNRISFNPEMVQVHLQQKAEEYTRIHLFPDRKGNYFNSDYHEQLEHYSSVQNTFPITYGIGTNGLPSDAGTARIHQARQLQGYLLFFDQILVNHLTQLKNIPYLFSHKQVYDQASYYSRLPIEVAEFYELTDDDIVELLNEYACENEADRKNRMLDHFLSRYGESFLDLKEKGLEYAWGVRPESLLETAIHLKYRILQHVRYLSKYRFKAIDYFRPEQAIGKEFFAQHNSYTFKRIVYNLLNFPVSESEDYHSLVDHYAPFIPTKVSEEEKKRILSTPRESIVLSSQPENSDQIRFVLPEPSALSVLAELGGKREAYQIEAVEEKFRLLFRAPHITVQLGDFSTNELSENALEKLVVKFSKLARASEGFHVVEHLLLRPCMESQYRLAFTVKKNRSSGQFKSVSSGEYEEQKALASEVILAGTRQDRYALISIFGKYSISLQDAHGNTMMELEGVYEELEAKRWIETLVHFFTELDNSRFSNPTEISYELVRLEWPEDIFFNFQMTLVLPSWVSRFKDKDFTRLFDQALVQNIPAHIQVNKVYLDIDRMRLFESEFREWITFRELMWNKKEQLLSSDTPTLRVANTEWQQARISVDQRSLSLIKGFLLQHVTNQNPKA